MTVEQLYASIGSYDEVKTRLMNDSIVARFVMKFPGDPSYGQLVCAWKDGNDEGIFRASHTLKGVCTNLSLTALHELASEITEARRPGNDNMNGKADIDDLMEKLIKEYEFTVSMIEEFAGGQ